MLFCILICKHKYDVNDISRKLVSSFLIIILKEIIPVRYLFLIILLNGLPSYVECDYVACTEKCCQNG